VQQRTVFSRRFISNTKPTIPPVNASPSLSSKTAGSIANGAKSGAAADATAKLSSIERRLPRFLLRYLSPLRAAPLSHVTAFIVLHELTAIVPLFALAGAFHYYNWLPPYISEGKWVTEGIAMFGSWMRKRGWIGDNGEGGGAGMWWGRGENGVRIVVELATAYAITKAFLPLRLVLSVSLTPWFARWTVLPVMARLKGLFGKKPPKGAITSGVTKSGTTVNAGSTLPKNGK
jgi:hypothetical protein